MKPHSLGTVLPTEKTFAINERWHRQAVKQAADVAAATPALKNASVVSIGGEVRYYVAVNHYAVVSLRTKRVLWFVTRGANDFAVKGPETKRIARDRYLSS